MNEREVQKGEKTSYSRDGLPHIGTKSIDNRMERSSLLSQGGTAAILIPIRQRAACSGGNEKQYSGERFTVGAALYEVSQHTVVIHVWHRLAPSRCVNRQEMNPNPNHPLQFV